MLPHMGLGMGWRPELALAIERMPRLGFVELTAENVPPGAPLLPAVRQLRERGLSVIPHGISLSLGGPISGPPDARGLRTESGAKGPRM